MNFSIVNAFLEANGEKVSTGVEPKMGGVPVRQLHAASQLLGEVTEDSLDWSTLRNDMLDAMHKVLVDASIGVIQDYIDMLIPLSDEQRKLLYQMMCYPVQMSGDFWREVILRHGIVF